MAPDPTDPYGADLFTEAEGDDDTLARLGPLRPLAGLWRGARGLDDHPVAEGSERDAFVERFELEPIDRQTNGPQIFYGLRYRTRIVRPGEVETFHDQVGHWLWEPAAGQVLLTLSIPRGQALLAGGPAAPDARSFEVRAERGSTAFGILSNPFLERAFRTTRFVLRVTVHDDDTWSYVEETTLEIEGRGTYLHRDENTLTRVAPASPNPLARGRNEVESP